MDKGHSHACENVLGPSRDYINDLDSGDCVEPESFSNVQLSEKGRRRVEWFRRMKKARSTCTFTPQSRTDIKDKDIIYAANAEAYFKGKKKQCKIRESSCTWLLYLCYVRARSERISLSLFTYS